MNKNGGLSLSDMSLGTIFVVGVAILLFGLIIWKIASYVSSLG